MKRFTVTLLLLLGATASARQRDALTPVYRQTQLELQDEQGQVVFWIDGLERVHSPDLIAWQQEYNSRIRASFRSLIGFGLVPPDGIALLEPNPPGRRGIQSGGVFAVPPRIAENGVLTRDTLSVPFFELGVEWNFFARALDSDCATALRAYPTLDCARYHIDWRSSSDEVEQPPPADDPLFFGLRRADLQKALRGLRRLQALLATVTTITVGGERSNEVRDRELYEARDAQCRRRSVVFNVCNLDAGDLTYPFDWMTVQVVSAELRPEFLDDLHDAEAETQRFIAASEREREMSQTVVYAADRR